MIKELCVECCRDITDPVCTDCYVKQVQTWLDHNNAPSSFKNKFMTALKSKFFHVTDNDGNCVLCFRGEVSVCYYCFYSSSLRILKRLQVPDGNALEFRRVFNYRVMSEPTGTGLENEQDV
jgi:hypothetical protein